MNINEHILFEEKWTFIFLYACSYIFSFKYSIKNSRLVIIFLSPPPQRCFRLQKGLINWQGNYLFLISFAPIIKCSVSIIFWRLTKPSFKYNEMASPYFIINIYMYCQPNKYDIKMTAFILFRKYDLFSVK